jgi:hypothetical protein
MRANKYAYACILSICADYGDADYGDSARITVTVHEIDVIRLWHLPPVRQALADAATGTEVGKLSSSIDCTVTVSMMPDFNSTSESLVYPFCNA